MGKRVHEALEFLYNEILAGRIPLLDAVLDKYDALWEDHWHDRIAIVKRDISIEQTRRIGEACLARYYRNQHPFDTPVIHNELDMKFSIDPDGTYNLRGIVDRVDRFENGQYEIHDYKTSGRAMSQNEANKDRQLALYQIGLTEIFPDVREVKLVWHFLRQGIRREVVKSAADLDKLIDKIKALIDTIKKDHIQVLLAANYFERRKPQLIADRTGMYACPHTGVALAVMMKLVQRGVIPKMWHHTI